jgi:hypothetical protein
MKKRRFRFYSFNSGKSYHHSLYLFGKGCWTFYYSKNILTFQILGRGLICKKVLSNSPVFSERYKPRRSIKLGKLHFAYIPKRSVE